MIYNPFYIEAFKTGLEKDKSDFQLLGDAFSVLQDAFIWRDRLIRKKGYRQVGRLLRILAAQALGNVVAVPDTFNIKTLLTLEANAEIAQSSVAITVDAGNLNQEIFTEPAIPDGTLVGDSGGTGTINYFTCVVVLLTSGSGWVIGDAIIADFNYYPALPCMGFGVQEEVGINDEETIAFDTVYVYYWNDATARFEELNPANPQIFTGTNWQFFWTTNMRTSVVNGAINYSRSIFFVTNFNNVTDQMYFYDSDAVAANRWQQFSPAVDGAGTEIHQARILIPYKGRLVALNVWEGANLGTSVQYPNRARWSQNGDPIATLPTTTSVAWRSDIAGRGGYIDAPTSEHIVSASFVRDTLIVGFERSLWRLRYTGNEILPFVWEQVDNEFGVESTFSIVRADTTQLSVGSRGIVSCDSLNAKRIDEKIPNEVFKIHNGNNGVYRVHGTRDYDKELVYWTFPSEDRNRTFPDNVLVFNYENFSWSVFKDTLTCFGVLQDSSADKRWIDFPDTPWGAAEFAWNAGSLQTLYPATVAGNQQGYVVKMQTLSRNDPAFAITVITPGTPVQITIPNHNLVTSDFISISGILGTSNVLNGGSYQVNFVNNNVISLTEYDAATGLFVSVTVAGGSTYLGGGEVAQLHDFRARTKKFNFLENGKATELGYIDFLVNQTSSGEFNVGIYADHLDSVTVNTGDSFFNTTVSTQPYTTDIVGQNKLLHRMFSRMHVQFLQFELNLTDLQKVTPEIHDSALEVFAMTLYAEKSGRLV